jgi:ribonuclease HI
MELKNNDNFFSIFSDGGARGNPGPAAYGWVVFSDKNELVDLDSKYMGIATNNLAEYTGILKALTSALKKSNLTRINCYLDSELVVKQIRGEYKVKNADLQIICAQVQDLIKKFEKVNFIHVPRAENKFADKLVNIVLDAQNKTGM